jgi:hypothetical protein
LALMTRILAILLSYFGPTAVGILILLFFALLQRETTTAVGVTGLGVLLISAVFIRIYFAVWYARDKARSGALGLLALFGWLGWILLIVAEDRKNQLDRTVAPALADGAPLS